MSGHQHLALVFLAVVAVVARCRGAEIDEIVRRADTAIRSDWAATPGFACLERDEFGTNGRTSSKTFRVVMMEGSDYYLPVAVDDQPLTPDAHRDEQEKLRSEYEHRAAENAEARARRIARYRRQRDENGAMLLDFAQAFAFSRMPDELVDGRPAYVLSAIPRKRTPLRTRAAKVLSGMKGTLWIDRATFHTIRAEGDVIAPVPVYGIFAEVLPGTHVAFEMSPVNDSTWLLSALSMRLRVGKFFWFKSTRVTRTTWSDCRPDRTVLDGLLPGARQTQ